MVTGNPQRFLAGEVTIREDNVWKKALPAREALSLTALTLPLLLHYGYPLRPDRTG